MRNDLVNLDPARVKPFAKNPRKRFRGIAKLAESIRLIGQVTPIVVTKCDDRRFDAELVDGERRLRACLLGKMPVRAMFDACNGDRYIRSIAANFCREGHDPVEIMEAVLALRQDGRTHKQIAAMFGKTACWSIQHAALEKLAKPILDQLKRPGDEARPTKAERRAKGKIPYSLALLLVPLAKQDQMRCARHIASKKLSLAQARTYVRKQAQRKGIRVGTRQSPHQRWRAVETAVATCRSVVDRYLDKPGVEFERLVRSATYRERHKMAADIEKLCDSLLMLSDALT